MYSLDSLINLYQKLDAGSLDLLKSVYSSEVRFTDPVHEIIGLAELEKYFASMYADVTELHFTFEKPLIAGNRGSIQWTMSYQHPRLGGGRPIFTAGTTYVEFDGSGLIVLHRDYFDLGQMVYEQLPLLGPIVKLIRKRMGK